MRHYKTVTYAPSHTSKNLRLTLQVTDVLRLRIRALRSKDQQPQNVVSRNLAAVRRGVVSVYHATVLYLLKNSLLDKWKNTYYIYEYEM